MTEVEIDDGTVVIERFTKLDDMYVQWAEFNRSCRAAAKDKKPEDEVAAMKKQAEKIFEDFFVEFQERLPDIFKLFIEDQRRSMGISIVGVEKPYLIRIINKAKEHKIAAMLEQSKLVFCTNGRAQGLEVKPDDLPDVFETHEEPPVKPNISKEETEDILDDDNIDVKKITKQMIREFTSVPDPVEIATVTEILSQQSKVGLKIVTPECYNSPILDYQLKVSATTFDGQKKNTTEILKPDDTHFGVDNLGSVKELIIDIHPRNAEGTQSVAKVLKVVLPKCSQEISMFGKCNLNQIDYDLVDDQAKLAIEEAEEQETFECLRWAKVSLASKSSKGLKPARIISKNTTLCIVENCELLQWGMTLGLQEGKVIEQPACMFIRKGLLINSMAIGNTFCVVSTIDGKVFTWGDNRFGQLGNGSFSELVPNPVEVAALKNEFVIDVRAGYGHALCLTDQGKAYSWGQRQALVGAPVINRFGDEISFSNTGTNQPIPQNISTKYISTDDKVTKICSGEFHLGMVTQKGQVYLWGDNEENMFGEYPACNSVIPVHIPVSSGKAIGLELGFNHCVLQVQNSSGEKEIYAWGVNKHCQCGKEKSDPLTQPTRVTSLKGMDLQHFSCGVERTYLTTTDGRVFIFGRKAEGLLDEDSPTPVLLPVQGKELWEFNGTFVLMN
jgi:alpha-tubulin suppressor-like RCC1 family protein